MIRRTINFEDYAYSVLVNGKNNYNFKSMHQFLNTILLIGILYEIDFLLNNEVNYEKI